MATQKKAISKPKPKPVPKPKYIVKVARMWHPDQEVYIDQEPVELKMDSWTECQLEAGLLIEVKV